MTIKVYSAEKEYGLEEKIKSQASVAFVSEIESVKEDDIYKKIGQRNIADFITKAGIKDPDLYHVYSILVSTVWNKNDDIFNPMEVWKARHSARFKPTNVEHDEKKIIGGIVDVWPVDEEYNLIADDTEIENLPSLYHLLVSSVIYKQWQDPELKERAFKLIEEIEANEKFVSMECIFYGFDYGIVTPDGQNKIIARNEETAFLTKHLKAYGGDGVYQDHKIGRMLRSIIFSGKGYVRRPANEGSIVFDKDHIFSFANASIESKSLFSNKNGVTTNSEQLNRESKENFQMSDVLNEQIKELKEQVTALQSENKKLNDQLSEASVSSYEDKISKLEETIATLNEKISSLEKEVSEATDKSESLESDLSTANEELAKAKKDMKEMEDEKKKKERKDKMVKAGLSEEEAVAKCELFADLNDKQFDSIVETMAASINSEEEEESSSASENNEEEEDTTEASEVVEENEEESGNHSVSSEDDETELSEARAGLQEWVENLIKS